MTALRFKTKHTFSCRSKFGKLVHLVGCIIKKAVKMWVSNQVPLKSTII